MPAGRQAPAAGRDAIPRRWTLHWLNNGMIFGATCRGVGVLPRAASYAIGDAGTWLAWRLMRQTRGAIADNLRAIFPDESVRALERRARTMLGAYARDVIDFIRALGASAAERQALFDYRPEDQQLFHDLLARGRGIAMRASGLTSPLASLQAGDDARPWAGCQRPWTLAYVTANGNVLPCCISPWVARDYGGLILGNAFVERFEKIWDGTRYQQFRTDFETATPPDPCRGCGHLWSI